MNLGLNKLLENEDWEKSNYAIGYDDKIHAEEIIFRGEGQKDRVRFYFYSRRKIKISGKTLNWDFPLYREYNLGGRTHLNLYRHGKVSSNFSKSLNFSNYYLTPSPYATGTYKIKTRWYKYNNEMIYQYKNGTMKNKRTNKEKRTLGRYRKIYKQMDKFGGFASYRFQDKDSKNLKNLYNNIIQGNRIMKNEIKYTPTYALIWFQNIVGQIIPVCRAILDTYLEKFEWFKKRIAEFSNGISKKKNGF